MNHTPSMDAKRIIDALYLDVPKPPVPLEDMTAEMANEWAHQSMESYPGGVGAFARDQIMRNAMVTLVLQLRTFGHLRDEDKFASALNLLSTANGRNQFLRDLETDSSAANEPKSRIQRPRSTPMESAPL